MSSIPSFVFYKLPNRFELYYNSSKASIIHNISDLEDSSFVIAPFDKEADWPLFAFDAKQSQIIQAEELLKIKIDLRMEKMPAKVISKENHMKKVALLVEELKRGKIRKAVLSRVKKIENRPKELPALFLALTHKYPNAFVYLCQLPNGQLWCGASPETLASFEEGQFRTMALAGTQSLSNREAQKVIWEKKELDEQKWVQDFIIEGFKKKEVPYSTSETYTATAGHLVHLRTDFKGLCDARMAQDLILEFHPTPAICGTPTRASKELILKTESHDRIYYSGFIGLYAPLRFELFVNLRCMRLDEEAYYLYVGGGITVDSEPEAEYEETENKAEVLRSVILEAP